MSESKDLARSKKLQLLAEDFCATPNISNNLLYLKDYRHFCYYQEKLGYWEILKDQEEFFYKKVYSNYFVNITQSWISSFAYNVGFHCHLTRNNYYSDYIALSDCLLNT